GDALTLDGGAGNDTLDATLLGSAMALTLLGNAGNDTLKGSSFNDIIDGGVGSDRLTGGPGLDIFRDASGAADTDVLVENQNLDLGLYGDLFITGVLLGDNYGTHGNDPYSTATG